MTLAWALKSRGTTPRTRKKVESLVTRDDDDDDDDACEAAASSKADATCALMAAIQSACDHICHEHTIHLSRTNSKRDDHPPRVAARGSLWGESPAESPSELLG